MAEHIDGRREAHTLAAGVLGATVDGVMFGVGSGPMRARAGVGGWISGLGSKNGGRIVEGVGVHSCDAESICVCPRFFVGVGVVGDERPYDSGRASGTLHSRLPDVKVSSSGVKIGTICFQVLTVASPPGEGGVGENLSTSSCHLSKVACEIWSFQLILLRYIRSFILISQTFKPDILLHALAE